MHISDNQVYAGQRVKHFHIQCHFTYEARMPSFELFQQSQLVLLGGL
jgi:hypothetical protein